MLMRKKARRSSSWGYGLLSSFGRVPHSDAGQYSRELAILKVNLLSGQPRLTALLTALNYKSELPLEISKIPGDSTIILKKAIWQL